MFALKRFCFLPVLIDLLMLEVGNLQEQENRIAFPYGFSIEVDTAQACPKGSSVSISLHQNTTLIYGHNTKIPKYKDREKNATLGGAGGTIDMSTRSTRKNVPQNVSRRRYGRYRHGYHRISHTKFVPHKRNKTSRFKSNFWNDLFRQRRLDAYSGNESDILYQCDSEYCAITNAIDTAISSTVVTKANPVKDMLTKLLKRSHMKHIDHSKYELGTRYMSLLLVCDKSFLEYHKHHDYDTYVATALGVTAQILHDATLGVNIEMSLTRTVYLEDPKLFRYDGDLASLLEYFCLWSTDINPTDFQASEYHDVSILVTRSLNHTRKCGRTGLSYQGGGCSRNRSCIVVQDTGLLLGVDIAHHIGHLFGATDDGVNSSQCGDDTNFSGIKFHHVMAPVSRHGGTVWSKCSRASVLAFVKNVTSACLEDIPPRSPFPFSGILPGVMYDHHYQCNLEIPFARYCFNILFRCNLNCQTNGTCIYTGESLAQGTGCGVNKWCYNGLCVQAGERPGSISGGWSSWHDWSPCSRTCGGGVQRATRVCDMPPPARAGRHCVGEPVRYRTCNVMPCDHVAPTFYAIQCEALSGVVDGRIRRWGPTTTTVDGQCGLYCVDQDGVKQRLGQRMVDGTPCRTDTNDMCIEGVCMTVGCDWVIGSDAVLDRCGLCRGDGARCIEKSKWFNATYATDTVGGMKRVVVIPRGSLKIRIYEGKPTNNHVVIANITADKDITVENFYVGNKNIVHPEDHELRFFIKKTPGVCTQLQPKQSMITIDGPLPFDVGVFVKVHSDPISLHYEYISRRIPLMTAQVVTLKSIEHRPFIERHNPLHWNWYQWECVEWSPCSARCEVGTAVCDHHCISMWFGRVSDSYCDSRKRPAPNVRVCNERPCYVRWRAGQWGECVNNVQYREVLCVKEARSYLSAHSVTLETLCGGQKPLVMRACTETAPAKLVIGLSDPAAPGQLNISMCESNQVASTNLPNVKMNTAFESDIASKGSVLRIFISPEKCDRTNLESVTIPFITQEEKTTKNVETTTTTYSDATTTTTQALTTTNTPATATINTPPMATIYNPTVVADIMAKILPIINTVSTTKASQPSVLSENPLAFTISIPAITTPFIPILTTSATPFATLGTPAVTIVPPFVMNTPTITSLPVTTSISVTSSVPVTTSIPVPASIPVTTNAPVVTTSVTSTKSNVPVPSSLQLTPSVPVVTTTNLAVATNFPLTSLPVSASLSISTSSPIRTSTLPVLTMNSPATTNIAVSTTLRANHVPPTAPTITSSALSDAASTANTLAATLTKNIASINTLTEVTHTPSSTKTNPPYVTPIYSPSSTPIIQTPTIKSVKEMPSPISTENLVNVICPEIIFNNKSSLRVKINLEQLSKNNQQINDIVPIFNSGKLLNIYDEACNMMKRLNVNVTDKIYYHDKCPKEQRRVKLTNLHKYVSNKFHTTLTTPDIVQQVKYKIYNLKQLLHSKRKMKRESKYSRNIRKLKYGEIPVSFNEIKNFGNRKNKPKRKVKRDCSYITKHDNTSASNLKKKNNPTNMNKTRTHDQNEILYLKLDKHAGKKLNSLFKGKNKLKLVIRENNKEYICADILNFSTRKSPTTKDNKYNKVNKTDRVRRIYDFDDLYNVTTPKVKIRKIFMRSTKKLRKNTKGNEFVTKIPLKILQNIVTIDSDNKNIILKYKKSKDFQWLSHVSTSMSLPFVIDVKMDDLARIGRRARTESSKRKASNLTDLTNLIADVLKDDEKRLQLGAKSGCMSVKSLFNVINVYCNGNAEPITFVSDNNATSLDLSALINSVFTQCKEATPSFNHLKESPYLYPSRTFKYLTRETSTQPVFVDITLTPPKKKHSLFKKCGRLFKKKRKSTKAIQKYNNVTEVYFKDLNSKVVDVKLKS